MRKFGFIFLMAVFFLTGCSSQNLITPDTERIKVTSTSFKNGEFIPKKYSPKEGNISPQLTWEKGPDNTVSYLIITEDPDAPIPFYIPVHWIVYNIPEEKNFLDENLPKTFNPEKNIFQGKAFNGKPGYFGPEPPFGKHRYYFKVYGLDKMLNLKPEEISRGKILNEIKDHITAYGEIMGVYEK